MISKSIVVCEESIYTPVFLVSGNQEDWSIDGFFANNDGFRDQSGYDQQKIKIQSRFSLSSWNALLNASLTNLNQETAGYVNGLNSYKDESFSKQNFNPEAYRDANSQRVSLRLTKENDNNLDSITPYIRSNDMKFFQHFLPGTPLEENNHKSIGIIFQRISEYRDFNLVRGLQIDIAKAELTETQKDALTTSSAFNNATRPKGKHYDYEVDSFLIGYQKAFKFRHLSME